MRISLDEELRTAPTHTAEEVLSEWSRNIGQPMSSALFFGITRAAHYTLQVSAGRVRFSTCHPGVLVRGFLAMNVPLEVYNIGFREPFAYAIGPVVKQGALVELSCRQSSDAYQRVAASSYKWLRPGDAELGSVVLDLSTALSRGQATCGPGDQVLTFFVPYIETTSWCRGSCVGMALLHHLQQMQQTQLGAACVGIAAVTRLADHLDAESGTEDWRALFTTASRRERACHRDLFAEFLAEAAEETGRPGLLVAAQSYQEIAAAWRAVHANAHRETQRQIAQRVRAIGVQELTALRQIKGCVA